MKKGRIAMKIDFKKEYSELYNPKKNDFTVVKVPKMKYFMIDGKGDPNTSKDYENAIQALYSVSYTLKFMSKNELGKDYTVPPLEGLWWAKNMKDFDTGGNKNNWLWTAMIMIPDWIPAKMIKSAMANAKEKKVDIDFSKVRIEPFAEGPSVQIMYVGPYKDEGPVIAEMHGRFMPMNKLAPNGKHHEIYMSDPRKTAPSKLRTIIRQPVKKMAVKK